MIRVNQWLRVYEVDDEGIPFNKAGMGQKEMDIGIGSCWDDGKVVVLMISKTYLAVSAGDLMAAIQNATNVNRF